jgi:hypothetical protein
MKYFELFFIAIKFEEFCGSISTSRNRNFEGNLLDRVREPTPEKLEGEGDSSSTVKMSKDHNVENFVK